MKTKRMFVGVIVIGLVMAFFAIANIQTADASAGAIAVETPPFFYKSLFNEEAINNWQFSNAAVEHKTSPGEPGDDGLVKEEIDTSTTADRKMAFGDSFRLNNYERPFTAGDMVYHPEIDILNLIISKDADFYYFVFELNGVSMDKNYASAAYGVEIDSDRDGRGDFLLYAQGSSTAWTTEGVMFLQDSNNDVGGSRPVYPDSGGGDGYDQIIFSAEVMDDPDAAWMRVDPANPAKFQLALKTTLIDKDNFFWKAFANGGIVDPARFDYNDNNIEIQAGSPNTISQFYPVGDLDLLDSTCWIAYNFRPTGYEPCSCSKPITPEPKPRKPKLNPVLPT